MSLKLFRNAALFTPRDPGRPPAGKDQGEVRVFAPGALVCRNGRVAAVGPESEVLAALSGEAFDQEVDCRGMCLVPGFVDPHTHLCFAGLREAEFRLRLAGTAYLDILRRGGGILSTVRAVRAADPEALFAVTRRRALSALGFGTTTLEIKSGYGLDTASELKMLAVIARVGRETPLDVVPTFLGAHAVPEEFRADPEGFVGVLIEEMLPAVRAQGVARF